MLSKESRHQVLATLCVNIITIIYGVAIGWPSASLLILQSTDTPLPSGPLSTAEASWIGSLIALGGLIGNLVFGSLSGRIGRKTLLLMATGPMVSGWILIYMASDPYWLYAGRLVHGVSGGTVYVVLPVFVAEISSSRIRGILGSMFMLACNFGIFLAFVMGHFLRYDTLQLVMLGGCVVYFGGLLMLPETPQYLLRTGQHEAAEKSLRFYRNLGKETKEQISLLQTELETLRVANNPQAQSSDTKGETETAADPITFRDFCTPHARKGLFIGVFLLWLKTYSGLYAMVSYAAQIFANSGSSLSPNASAIVIGAIQLAGTYVAILLVDRLGRRILLALSTIGTGASLIGLAVYQHMLQSGVAGVANYGWVPVVCFSAVLFLGSCGMLPLPFLVMAEVMPAKIRSYGYSMGMLTLWVFAFALMKMFPLLVEMVGLHGCFYGFAACSFAGTVFVATCLPETRGKSFEEIRRLMEGRRG